MLLNNEVRENLYVYVQNKYNLFRRAVDENKVLPMGQYSDAYTEYLKLDNFMLYENGRALVVAEFRFIDRDSYHNKSGLDTLSTTIHVEVGNNCYLYKEFSAQVDDIIKSKDTYVGYVEQYAVDIIKNAEIIGSSLLELSSSLKK